MSSTSKRRRRKKRSDKMLIALFIATFVLALGFMGHFYMKRKYGPRSPASIESQKEQTPMAEIVATLRRELGNDDTGVVIAAIIISQFSDSPNSKNSSKGLCAKQDTCPYEIVALYRNGFQRLEKSGDLKAKEVLQKALFASDLSQEQKIKLLMGELRETKLAAQSKKSVLFDKEHIQFSDNTHYLMYTAGQLYQLKAKPNEITPLIVAALKRSDDSVGRDYLSPILANDIK